MLKRILLPCVLLPMLSACGTAPSRPVTTVASVDLQRFMGDWYVIACIPTFIEKGAYNAVESYRLEAGGTIATTFRFNKDALNGPLKVYTPSGFVLDDSHARWGMRFVWPFKLDYRISYLSPDYQMTVVGREARDHAWIMARTPQIAADEYQQLVNFIRDEGYDVSRLVRIQHAP